MRKLIVILTLIAIFSVSCKTTEVVERVKWEYQSKVVADSVFIDCSDSVFVFKDGDTVTIREIKSRIEYRYKMLNDTIFRHDTLSIVKEYTNTTQNRKNGCKFVFFLGFAIAIIIIFAIRILIKKFLR